MHYIIQENLFREPNYDMLVSILERLRSTQGPDGGFQVVKIVPFTREIVFERTPPTSNVFCFGSVKMARIASDYGWTPGSFMNENHDYRVYSERYGKDQLLNGDSIVCRFADSFAPPGHIFFARPCEDTKTFSGQLFIKDSWDEFVKNSLGSGHTTTLNADTAIQIASLKEIQREVRVWIVKGQVVTASQYRLGTQVIYSECTEPYILDYAREMAKVYQPAEAFVLDVAMTDKGPRIIEVSCINCVGFYRADMSKLINSLEEAFTVQP
jgi:hypothetical protein